MNEGQYMSSSSTSSSRTPFLVPTSRTSFFALMLSGLSILYITVHWGIDLNGVSRCTNGNDSVLAKKDDFALAKKQSFGFFDDVTSAQWNLHRQIVAEHKNHIFMDDPLSYKVEYTKVDSGLTQAWFQSHYEPNFSCQFKRRVGGNGNGDGPKFVCDIHRLKQIALDRKAADSNLDFGCLIYSIGSNGDFAFEEAVQNLLGKDTCEIHIFDMGDFQETGNPRMGDFQAGMPQDLNLHYHQWGLDSKTYVTEQGQSMKTLEDTIKLLGHVNRPAIDLFKIDCEGCEFATYPDWISNNPNIPRLQQIMVEVHNPNAQMALEFFDGFHQAGYVMFSKEVNIQYPNMAIAEFSFLKLDQDFFNTTTVY